MNRDATGLAGVRHIEYETLGSTSAEALALARAGERGPHNIRCNVVVPSWMWGPPVERFVKGEARRKGISREAALQEIVGRFPLRRICCHLLLEDRLDL